MYSKTSIAALFGAFLTASAQTTTPSSAAAKATGPIVSVLLPGADNQTLVGSVIAVKSALTTLNVECAPGTDSNDCGMPLGGMEVTQGPSTAVMSTVFAQESDPVVVTYEWECSIGGTTTAKCTYSNAASVTGSVDPSLLSSMGVQMTAFASTTELNEQDLETAFFKVAITAGADKLSQTGDAEATGSGSGSPTGSAASPSNTGAASNVKMGGFAIGGALAAVFML
ncbi:uncharacterized protein N0V89_011868 [Didymosphaeria variabile]|uniref:GPI anchored cell wall protein n=1 Tax=Didymosphaeria variabile TaxID=1932322 RepID=A0A9W8XC33_9PLEO|nr:uncharacterized protein N0V89_011868 [Didymosphaeria variabile]KAJ4345733.1 hypothetical protein N0V89_011868 [Didymosphaeria variabile]